MQLTLADFDFALPPHLIAQTLLAQRTASRLLVLDGARLTDSRFANLPQQLQPGDLLVMNDTRVFHARLLGRKESGGQVEVLIERLVTADTVHAQVRASKPPRAGTRLLLEDVLQVEVLGRTGEFYQLRFPGDAQALIERHGHLPLPPYIQRAAGTDDEARYQTVYARARGSVAAPTAGLHFDEALLGEFWARGIASTWLTLHVGAGTFQPVRTADLSRHQMHAERWFLPQAAVEAVAAAKARGGRVVAVGTTSLRALESAALADAAGGLRAGQGETSLFITPGFKFKIVDALITNFHLPKSTLLMLAAAFAGLENIRRAYAHAIQNNYRFFSYGDAMLIQRQCHEI